jgi:hypothetical protein
LYPHDGWAKLLTRIIRLLVVTNAKRNAKEAKNKVFLGKEGNTFSYMQTYVKDKKFLKSLYNLFTFNGIYGVGYVLFLNRHMLSFLKEYFGTV